MSVYPMWMNKRGCVAIEIPVPVPTQGGGGGGGVTLAYRDKPIPKVKIRKVVVLDDYEDINITVLRVIDLSLDGGN